MAGTRSEGGGKACVEVDPSRRAGTGVTFTLLFLRAGTLASVMDVDMLIAPTAGAGLCLNLEVGAGAPGRPGSSDFPGHARGQHPASPASWDQPTGVSSRVSVRGRQAGLLVWQP